MAIRVNAVAKEEDGYIQVCGGRSGVDHVAMEDWNGGHDMSHRWTISHDLRNGEEDKS